MRVIAGVARSCPLIAPIGNDTRPTTDKTKETLFNVLMPYLYSDSHFLDLFSGCGGIGIEALSRGVEKACFVEKSKNAIKCIEANLEKTHFNNDSSKIYSMDVFSALHQLEGKDKFDLVFMDPPYDEGLENALEKIKAVLDSDEIMAQKKGKKGKRRILKETNIKEFIVKHNISIRDDNIVLNIRLLAGPDKNLNPSLLFDTIIRLIDMDFEWKSISRINLLTSDLKEYK